MSIITGLGVTNLFQVKSKEIAVFSIKRLQILLMVTYPGICWCDESDSDLIFACAELDTGSTK